MPKEHDARYVYQKAVDLIRNGSIDRDVERLLKSLVLNLLDMCFC